MQYVAVRTVPLPKFSTRLRVAGGWRGWEKEEKKEEEEEEVGAPKKHASLATESVAAGRSQCVAQRG